MPLVGKSWHESGRNAIVPFPSLTEPSKPTAVWPLVGPLRYSSPSWNARFLNRKSMMLPSWGCNQFSFVVGKAPEIEAIDVGRVDQLTAESPHRR